MREIGTHCPVREFCSNYSDESDMKVTPLDIQTMNKEVVEPITDCMTENAFLFMDEKCPMIKILLERAEKQGKSELPGMKFLRDRSNINP